MTVRAMHRLLPAASCLVLVGACATSPQPPLAPLFGPGAQGYQAQVPAQSAAPPPGVPAPANAGVPPGAPGAGWRRISSVDDQSLGKGAELNSFTVSNGMSTAEVKVIVFDSKQCVLRVIDQPNGHAGGGAITHLLRAQGALAGVNGGFFHPDFQPLGIFIAGGRKTGGFTTNNLISGSVLMVGGEPYLVWNAEFLGEKGVTDMIQSGPRLVDNGAPVAGLKRDRSAPRTFVATDGRRGWAIGVVRSTSLGGLAELLTTPDLMPGLRVQRALNLDGGNSSALWARTSGGREISEPGWSTVRNYLAVVAR